MALNRMATQTLQEALHSPDFQFSGHLKKKQEMGKLKMWSTYYVILTKKSLLIFPAEASRNPHAKFMTSLLLYDQIIKRHSKSHYSSFLLKPLISTVPQLIFGCVTPRERDTWMREIHQAMLWTHSRHGNITKSAPLPSSPSAPPSQAKKTPNDNDLNVYDDIEERQLAIGRVQVMNITDLIDFSNDGIASPNQRGSYPSDDSSDSEFSDDSGTKTGGSNEGLPEPSAPTYESYRGLQRELLTGDEVEQQQAAADDSTESSETYYKKSHFFGSRNDAFELMCSVRVTGMYLVRIEEATQRKVLTVRHGNDIVKYVILTDLSTANQAEQAWIEGSDKRFDSLPHLLHFYHYHPLPNREVQLVVPYQLV